MGHSLKTLTVPNLKFPNYDSACERTFYLLCWTTANFFFILPLFQIWYLQLSHISWCCCFWHFVTKGPVCQPQLIVCQSKPVHVDLFSSTTSIAIFLTMTKEFSFISMSLDICRWIPYSRTFLKVKNDENRSVYTGIKTQSFSLEVARQLPLNTAKNLNQKPTPEVWFFETPPVFHFFLPM